MAGRQESNRSAVAVASTRFGKDRLAEIGEQARQEGNGG